jgi:hypothetical protein
MVCVCQFNAGDKTFPIGSVVPQSAIDASRNKEAILGSFIRWEPPTYTPAVFPRDIPTPAPVQAKPKVKIVPHKDPATSWRLSVAELAKELNGNVAKAKDLLLATREGADLYKLACRVAIEAERKKHIGMVSISPEMVGL